LINNSIALHHAGAGKKPAAAKGKSAKAKAPTKKAGAKSKAAPKKRTGKRGDSSDEDGDDAGDESIERLQGHPHIAHTQQASPPSPTSSPLACKWMR
jgi:hypothetical protein